MQLPPRSPSPLRDGLTRPAHDVIHTSNSHASYTRVMFSVYLFRPEHAAAVRGVTHKSQEGAGEGAAPPPRGERSEPLRTSTTVQRMSHTYIPITDIHTCHFVYRCMFPHTYIHDVIHMSTHVW